MTRVEYRILGPLEVFRSGEAVVLGPKARGLLAVMLLQPNEVVSMDRLADELWGERQPASAAKLVQLYASQVRKAVGDALVTRSPGYLLKVETDELDATRFRLLLSQARAAAEQAPAEARELYSAALDLWRGRVLADVAFESFAANEAEALDTMRPAALEERFDVELALGRSRELVPELEELVAAQPLRERPRAQLMLALYRSGRRADALALYRETRRFMIDELGLEPGEEQRELERAILQNDSALADSSNGHPDEATRDEHSIAATARKRRLRPQLVLAGLAVAVAAAASAVLFIDRGSSGTGTVGPNSLAVIDPGSGRVVGSVPVGARPSALAYASGSLWWQISTMERSRTSIQPRSACCGRFRLDRH